MGKTCCDIPCISMSDLGKGGAHGCNAHNLFDGMPSQHELFEEDILLVMNEEKITREEAMHLLQEGWAEAMRRFERRFDEKLDQLLELFGVKVARSEACENREEGHSTSINSTNSNAKSVSFSSPASPTPVPTICSMNCSNPNIGLDITMAVVDMEGTTSMASMVMEKGDDTTNITYMNTLDHSKVAHAKCSTAGLAINGGTDQAMIVFPAMKSVSKFIPTSVAPRDTSPRIIASDKWNTMILTRQPLMAYPKRISWLPACLGEVGKIIFDATMATTGSILHIFGLRTSRNSRKEDCQEPNSATYGPAQPFTKSSPCKPKIHLYICSTSSSREASKDQKLKLCQGGDGGVLVAMNGTLAISLPIPLLLSVSNPDVPEVDEPYPEVENDLGDDGRCVSPDLVATSGSLRTEHVNVYASTIRTYHMPYWGPACLSTRTTVIIYAHRRNVRIWDPRSARLAVLRQGVSPTW
uniref:Uncharacterized protein n=1 Tax=Leersia perrieri TaxID=77586 RepID=A0A0D9W3B8_9ORYZ